MALQPQRICDVESRHICIAFWSQATKHAVHPSWSSFLADDLGVSLKLLGLISYENLWLLIARHSALQERGANDQVIRSLA